MKFIITCLVVIVFLLTQSDDRHETRLDRIEHLLETDSTGEPK